MSTISYIKNSLEKQILERKEYQLFNKHWVMIQSPLPKEINMTNVIRQIEKNLPYQLATNLNNIFVGDFDILDKREVESVYIKHDIYISNRQESEELMVSSIIHEIAHSLEEAYGEEIYGDSEIIDEFIAKRKKLADLLKMQGIHCSMKKMVNTGYDQDLDEFFYKEVGYDLLNRLCSGLFISAYACTSLREYFSNGFEHYFMKDNNYIDRISPKLYEKIKFLTKNMA
jgi:regulator of sigma D